VLLLFHSLLLGMYRAEHSLFAHTMSWIRLGHVKSLRVVFAAKDQQSKAARELLRRLSTYSIKDAFPRCDIKHELLPAQSAAQLLVTYGST
jgi:hypothetical protein